MSRVAATALISLIALTHCTSSKTDDSTGSGAHAPLGGGTADGGSAAGGNTTGNSGGGGSTSEGGSSSCEPVAVPCEDQVFLQMNLQDDVADAKIETSLDGEDFVSTIDATAGGAFTPNPESYVYAAFSASGLTQVMISDEEALTSTAWDIAFRRYVVRINSGNSGPSCVTAGRLPGAPAYDEVTAASDAVTFHTDEYFTNSCELIPDGSGLPSSPATALSSYWSYPGCVQMTGNVFVLRRANGEALKLQVESYYSPDVQSQCDGSGSIPQSNTGAANFVVRWAMLP